eukprot:3446639-Prymnesium_polylepis.1
MAAAGSPAASAASPLRECESTPPPARSQSEAMPGAWRARAAPAWPPRAERWSCLRARRRRRGGRLLLRSSAAAGCASRLRCRGSLRVEARCEWERGEV